MERTRGEWNAYVAAGADSKERTNRLMEVPEKWRVDVKRHVETVISIRNFHANNPTKKQRKK